MVFVNINQTSFGDFLLLLIGECLEYLRYRNPYESVDSEPLAVCGLVNTPPLKLHDYEVICQPVQRVNILTLISLVNVTFLLQNVERSGVQRLLANRKLNKKIIAFRIK